jgi:hypothetical protein
MNERKISVGINVKSPANLPQLGERLAAFFRALEPEIGPFDVSLAVSVNPTDAAAIGPIEYPKDERDIEIVFIPDQSGDHEKEAD